MDKREAIFKQAQDIAAHLYGEDQISDGEIVFKEMFKKMGVIYSSSHLKSFAEGIIFSQGVTFAENIQTLSLIMAVLEKYNKTKLKWKNDNNTQHFS